MYGINICGRLYCVLGHRKFMLNNNGNDNVSLVFLRRCYAGLDIFVAVVVVNMSCGLAWFVGAVYTPAFVGWAECLRLFSVFFGLRCFENDRCRVVILCCLIRRRFESVVG